MCFHVYFSIARSLRVYYRSSIDSPFRARFPSQRIGEFLRRCVRHHRSRHRARRPLCVRRVRRARHPVCHSIPRFLDRARRSPSSSCDVRYGPSSRSIDRSIDRSIARRSTSIGRSVASWGLGGGDKRWVTTQSINEDRARTVDFDRRRTGDRSAI